MNCFRFTRLFAAWIAVAVGALCSTSAFGAAGDFVQKITASDAAAIRQFGFSLSADPSRLVVGQLWDSGDSSGAAYVFTNMAGSWSETAKLTPIGGSSDDNFGHSVSLHRNLVIVGADGRDGGTDPGAAYVFRFQGGVGWQQEARLVASDRAAGDEFGTSVGIDGDSAIIGANRDDDHGNASGSAYIFDRDSFGSWSQRAKLTASDALVADQFGSAVGISGSAAIVGAFAKGADNVGGAYIFEKDAGGVWNEAARLTPSDAASDDRFGWSVAIDGNTAIVGAVNKNAETGAAYIFRADGGGNWNEIAKLSAPDADPGDAFGYSVDVLGEFAVVGGWLDDEAGTRAGAAYLFREHPSGSWQFTAKLTAFDPMSDDRFARAVALNSSSVFIGSIGDDDRGSSSGSVYIYQLPEPSSIVQLGLAALAGLFHARKRRRNRIAG